MPVGLPSYGMRMDFSAYASCETVTRRDGVKELGWRLAGEALTAGMAREDALAAVVMTA